MMILEDRVFSDVIKVKWYHNGGTLIWWNYVLLRGQKTKEFSVLHREKAMWVQSEKAAISKPGRKLSPDFNCTATLILDFQTPEMQEK